MRFAWKPSWGGGEYKGIRMLWKRLLSELSSSFKIAITRKCIEKGRVNKEKKTKATLILQSIGLNSIPMTQPTLWQSQE